MTEESQSPSPSPTSSSSAESSDLPDIKSHAITPAVLEAIAKSECAQLYQILSQIFSELSSHQEEQLFVKELMDVIESVFKFKVKNNKKITDRTIHTINYLLYYVYSREKLKAHYNNFLRIENLNKLDEYLQAIEGDVNFDIAKNLEKAKVAGAEKDKVRFAEYLNIAKAEGREEDAARFVKYLDKIKAGEAKKDGERKSEPKDSERIKLLPMLPMLTASQPISPLPIMTSKFDQEEFLYLRMRIAQEKLKTYEAFYEVITDSKQVTALAVKRRDIMPDPVVPYRKPTKEEEEEGVKLNMESVLIELPGQDPKAVNATDIFWHLNYLGINPNANPEKLYHLIALEAVIHHISIAMGDENFPDDMTQLLSGVYKNVDKIFINPDNNEINPEFKRFLEDQIQLIKKKLQRDFGLLQAIPGLLQRDFNNIVAEIDVRREYLRLFDKRIEDDKTALSDLAKKSALKVEGAEWLKKRGEEKNRRDTLNYNELCEEFYKFVKWGKQLEYSISTSRFVNPDSVPTAMGIVRDQHSFWRSAPTDAKASSNVTRVMKGFALAALTGLSVYKAVKGGVITGEQAKTMGLASLAATSIWALYKACQRKPPEFSEADDLYPSPQARG